jgi:hypothetical protein
MFALSLREYPLIFEYTPLLQGITLPRRHYLDARGV